MATKTLTTLICPNSGILPHVHHLNVLDTADLLDGNEYLRLLISALPRDALCIFVSDANIRLSTLQVILNCHRIQPG
jgi:hypothetical protein